MNSPVQMQNNCFILIAEDPINILKIMGCQNSALSQVANNSAQNQENQKIGVLEIKIKELYIRHLKRSNGSSNSQFVLRIQVSNQFEEFNIDDVSTSPGSQTICRFFINSVYQEYGRILVVQLLNPSVNQDDVGVGLFDVQPFITYPLKEEKKRENLYQNWHKKCYLNYRNRPAGFLEIHPRFTEEKYTQISFRLISAQLRRNNLHAKHFFARIIIGQQIFKSKFVNSPQQYESIEFPEHSIAYFKVPKSLHIGTVQLIASIGSLSLNLKKLMKKQMKIIEELTIQQGGEVTGEIIMFSVPILQKQKQQKIEYMQLDSPRKKPKPKKLVTLQNIRPGNSLQINDDPVVTHKKKKSPNKIYNDQNVEQVKMDKKSEKFLFEIQEERQKSSPVPVINIKQPKPVFNLIKVAHTQKQEQPFNPQSQQQIKAQEENHVPQPILNMKNGENASKESSLPPLEVRQALSNLRDKRQRKKSVCL